MAFIFPLPKLSNRNGKGVRKGEDTRPTFKNFFKQFFRKFSKLITLNLLMLLQMLPIIIAVGAYLFIDSTPSQSSSAFAPLYGTSLIQPSNTVTLVTLIEALPGVMQVYQPAAYWVIGGCALFFLLFNGWLSVGSYYVLRGLVRGDAVFIFSDFFYGIKRNLKQGFLFGLVDAVLCGVLTFDIIYYSGTGGTFWLDFMFWLPIGIAILYFIMRPFIYLMMITFDMKLRKMLKNALIFTALGVKRYIVAGVGILLLVGLHIVLLVMFMPEVIITLILPVLYIFAAMGFMTVYADYPIIERYMITPYRKAHPEEEPEDEVFDDDSGFENNSPSPM